MRFVLVERADTSEQRDEIDEDLAGPVSTDTRDPRRRAAIADALAAH